MVPVFVDGKKEYVLVPPDVKDGTTITVSGGGKHNPRSGNSGDLHVLIHIEDSAYPWKEFVIPAVLIVFVLVGAYFLMKNPMEQEICIGKTEV